MIRGIVAGVVSLLTALAQQTTFSGQVEAPAGTALHTYTVELMAADTRTFWERAPVQSDGTFQLRSVPPGSYRARLLAQNGDVLREDAVEVHFGMRAWQVRLEGPAGEMRPGGGISARRLGHQPPKEAERWWRQSLNAAAREDYPAALGALEKAVAADPEFFEALVNLGAARFRAGDLSGSLQALRSAAALDPAAPEPALNLALVLLRTGHPAEAETEARRGLRSSDSVVGHYLLGLSLANQSKSLPEALDHLRRAETSFPPARELRQAIERRLPTARIPAAASFTSRP